VLERHETLTVRQEVEALQAFSGLETKNRYKVVDSSGAQVCFAYEESSFLARQFLGSHRPLTLHIVDAQGSPLLLARRNFYWFYSHLEFLSPQGEFLGRLERRMGFLNRRFDLYDQQGLLCEVKGPMFKPNTFVLQHESTELAKINKQWSGIGREVFTAADNFHVEFSNQSTTEARRWLFLGTAFAIDLDFFEKRSSKRR